MPTRRGNTKGLFTGRFGVANGKKASFDGGSSPSDVAPSGCLPRALSLAAPCAPPRREVSNVSKIVVPSGLDGYKDVAKKEGF